MGGPRTFADHRIDLAAAALAIRRISSELKVICAPCDPYQMEEMAQRLLADRVAWMDPFNQMEDRLVADVGLRQMIVTYRVAKACDAAVAWRQTSTQRM